MFACLFVGKFGVRGVWSSALALAVHVFVCTSVFNLRTSNCKMASAVSLKHHTPFCRGNCNVLHHDLVAALFTDGRCAIARIERPGDLPLALKQAIESAKLSGWDLNCFIPDPLEFLRCPLLFLASAFGKVAIVEGLLRNDFSPRVLNQDGETALHFAVKYFHLNKVNSLQGRKGRKDAFKKVVDLLTEYDPKILADSCKNGRTALHVAASSFSKWKVDFYQFSTKLMMERLVELEDSSVLTRKEVMDIVKAPDLKGDTFMHMLTRNSVYFETLKFGGELLFRTLLAEAFPLCFSALYCHSLRGFGCSRFVLVVNQPRKRPLPTAACDSC